MAISRRTLLETIGAGVVGAVTAPAVASTRDEVAGNSVRGSGPIRLHRNESAYGPSPKATAAIRNAAVDAKAYPEAAADALRRKIAGHHGVSADRVVLGCGSSEILRMSIDAFARSDRKRIVAALPTFDTVGSLARTAGCEVVGVPLRKDWSHDVGALLARADATAGVVYICNPHNPTGTLTRRSDLESLIQQAPPHVVVVIDEAYHDFVGVAADYASFIDRPVKSERVIVTRSFSTVHGLAGLRIGYAITDMKTARALELQRLADGVNMAAARAAAAALDDREHLQTVLEKIANDRQEFLNEANARMLRSVDSLANFVMLNTGRKAETVVEHFGKHAIRLSGPVPNFEMYVRVSLGTHAEMREFWRVWDLLPGGHTMVM
jgi:histidinol-phosphate aminotransferase